MIYTQADVNLMAKCAWLEARSNGIQGCYAVLHVIYNRVGAPGFPKTIQEVIMAPNAFSWTRPDNPEHNLQPEESDFIYQQCLEDAEFVLAGESDPTRAAKYYENPANVAADSWFARHISGPDNMGMPGHEFTVQIGKHRFYR